jgi:hypothetical protein
MQYTGQIWMLTLYSKNVVEDIPAHVLRQRTRTFCAMSLELASTGFR